MVNSQGNLNTEKTSFAGAYEKDDYAGPEGTSRSTYHNGYKEAFRIGIYMPWIQGIYMEILYLEQPAHQFGHD